MWVQGGVVRCCCGQGGGRGRGQVGKQEACQEDKERENKGANISGSRKRENIGEREVTEREKGEEIGEEVERDEGR